MLDHPDRGSSLDQRVLTQSAPRPPPGARRPRRPRLRRGVSRYSSRRYLYSALPTVTDTVSRVPREIADSVIGREMLEINPRARDRRAAVALTVVLS